MTSFKKMFKTKEKEYKAKFKTFAGNVNARIAQAKDLVAALPKTTQNLVLEELKVLGLDLYDVAGETAAVRAKEGIVKAVKYGYARAADKGLSQWEQYMFEQASKTDPQAAAYYLLNKIEGGAHEAVDTGARNAGDWVRRRGKKVQKKFQRGFETKVDKFARNVQKNLIGTRLGDWALEKE